MSDANCLGRPGSMRVVLAKRDTPALIDQYHRIARKPVKFRNNPGKYGFLARRDQTKRRQSRTRLVD